MNSAFSFLPAWPLEPDAILWAGLALGLIVFCWAAELYGYPAGLFALLLYVFEPNLTAHSQLVTTDLYAALFITLALYTFWRLLARPGWGRLTASAVALGLAQVAKYTAAYLYPVLFVVALGWLWRQPGRRALPVVARRQFRRCRIGLRA